MHLSVTKRSRVCWVKVPLHKGRKVSVPMNKSNKFRHLPVLHVTYIMGLSYQFKVALAVDLTRYKRKAALISITNLIIQCQQHVPARNSLYVEITQVNVKGVI